MMTTQDQTYEYGSVTYEGKELELTQQPYLDGYDTVVYRADAIDLEGYCYQVIWDDIDLSIEDESECCDWENYRVIEY